MIRPLLLALPLALLAACGDGKDGTSITLNSDDGNVTASIGNSGQMAVSVPGFSGQITLPKLKLGADNFDMNGVHLYPGSSISGMNIDAHNKPGEDSDGQVRVSFESPARPGPVRDWFQQKLNAAGFKVAPNGSGLSGTTDDDKPFKLDLTPEGSDKARGTILIG